MPRNPAWTADELIVALDLYINVPAARASSAHPGISAASDLLRSLPIHTERPDPATFRNANSVYLKLQNFKTVDPGYTGKGMAAGAGKREHDVWERFAADPDGLRGAARAIQEASVLLSQRDIDALTPIDEDDASYTEGRLLLAIHRRRERRGAAKKKASVLRINGTLACEVCDFDFLVAYGELGKGFAECHHTRPLADGARQTRLRDLSIVCSNCHRMLHRRSPPLTTAELRELHLAAAELGRS